MIKPTKLDSKIVTLINERIKDEYTAHYFYVNASNWCRDKGFIKASKYFKKESKSELIHVNKLQQFLLDWNIVPTLPQLSTPQDFKTLVDVIEKSYGIEYDLYEKYEDTAMIAFKHPDLCAFNLFQEYITIQKDSVAEYSDMINMLDGVELNKMNLLLLEENLFGD